MSDNIHPGRRVWLCDRIDAAAKVVADHQADSDMRCHAARRLEQYRAELAALEQGR